jgi:hypothetical protein
MAGSSGHTLGETAARQLANTTKTPPQLLSITPRWLVNFLPPCSWRGVTSDGEGARPCSCAAAASLASRRCWRPWIGASAGVAAAAGGTGA